MENRKLQRLEEPEQVYDGEFDVSTLPYGTRLAKVLSVEVEINPDNFPERKKSQNIDMIFTLNVQPEGHRFPMKMWIDIRFNFDEELRVQANDSWDTPLSLRSNIHELHRILSAMGYTGGFTVNGEWADMDGDPVNNEDIPVSLNSYINELNPEVYLFIDRYTDKDGKVRLTPLTWAVYPPTEVGKKEVEYKTSKKLQAIEAAVKAANEPADKVIKPAAPIKGRRF